MTQNTGAGWSRPIDATLLGVVKALRYKDMEDPHRTVHDAQPAVTQETA